MPLRKGFEALKAALGHAAPAAVQAAAELVAAEVRARAPRLTGDLAAAVEVVTHPATDGHASASVEVSGGHDPREFIGSVEFGNHDQVANPFIRRSVASTRNRATASLQTDVKSAIRGR